MRLSATAVVWLLMPLMVLGLLAGASACAHDASGAGEASTPAAVGPAAAPAAAPAVPGAAAPAAAAAPAPELDASAPMLAETTTPGVPLLVQVLEATHATADTIRVALAFTNKSTGPEPLSLFAGTDPADFCLVTPDGTRRLFLLRDAQNKPVLDGNTEPLKPGERRVLHATFPAPPAQATRVTILLGKLALRNVPVSSELSATAHRR